MLTANSDLMMRARASLRGKWGIAAGISFVYMLITIVIGSLKYLSIASLIITGPLVVGYYIAILALIRNKEIRIEQLFEGFSTFIECMCAYLLMLLYIVLWMLLLIVPGILAALSYSMTMFLIADNPSMGARAAINTSKEMMHGNRWKLFCLLVRYLGWFLLGIVTAGIGFIWIVPYMTAGFAHFYQDVLDNRKQREEASAVRPLPV